LIELSPVELGIQPTFSQEFIVPAALHNPALIYDDDQVRVSYRGQPVGDHDTGTPLHRHIERLLDRNF